MNFIEANCAMNDKCKSCDKESNNLKFDTCEECYRDPETNNCVDCGKHLEGIPYEYVCGDCFLEEESVILLASS